MLPSTAWKPGESGNPLGAGTPAWKLQQRMKRWLEDKTIDQIKFLVENKDIWGSLPAIDGLLVRRISAALSAQGDTKDFVAILDYYAGKPSQQTFNIDARQQSVNVNIEALNPAELDAMRGVLSKMMGIPHDTSSSPSLLPNNTDTP